jgi:hypothetical protein
MAPCLALVLLLPAWVVAGSWEIGWSFQAPSFQTNGLTFDGRHLWHTNDFQPLIYQIDPLSGRVVKQTPTKVVEQGDLEFAGGVMYVVSENKHIIYKVNPATGATLDTIQVHGIPLGPQGPGRRDSIQMEGLTFDGRNIWVDGGTNKIVRIDPQTKAQYLYEMPFSMGYLDGMTWAFDHLWIVTNNATIYEIDPCSMGILDQFDAPAHVGGGPEGFAFDSENPRFSNNDRELIYKIILKDKLLTKRAAKTGQAGLSRRVAACNTGTLVTSSPPSIPPDEEEEPVALGQGDVYRFGFHWNGHVSSGRSGAWQINGRRSGKQWGPVPRHPTTPF